LTIDSMISAACLVNKPAKCRGQVISLAYVGPCAGPHHDTDDQGDGEDAALERDMDRRLDGAEFERWAS
jgi:hypothetical protein